VKNRIGLKNSLCSLKKGNFSLTVKRPDFNQAYPFIFALSILLILACIVPASAEMKQLSETQNGLFHINPKTMEFTAKTFISDNFIDKDQLDDFIKASWRTPYLPTDSPYLPADNNYPYSVSDVNTLSSDLLILYKYDNLLCCPYPAKAYLSRNNISISDYSNQPSPPTVVRNVIRGNDPFHNEKVTALIFCINNFEDTIDERIHTSKGGTGYLSNAYMKVISGRVAVWKRSKSYPICPEEPVKCKTCLPPSDRPKPKEPIYLVRVSSGNPCIGESVWPEPPDSSCVYGEPPPERTSVAASNWSYNYNLHKNQKSSNPNDCALVIDTTSQYVPQSTGYFCPSCSK
jgi:hypothetical protein